MSYVNEDGTTGDTLSVWWKIDSPKRYWSGNQREPEKRKAKRYASSHIPAGPEVYQFDSPNPMGRRLGSSTYKG